MERPFADAENRTPVFAVPQNAGGAPETETAPAEPAGAEKYTEATAETAPEEPTGAEMHTAEAETIPAEPAGVKKYTEATAETAPAKPAGAKIPAAALPAAPETVRPGGRAPETAAPGWAAAAAWALGIAYVQLILWGDSRILPWRLPSALRAALPNGLWWGAGLFCALFVLFVAGTARAGKAAGRTGGRTGAESGLWLGCLAAMGLGLTLGREGAVPSRLGILLLHAAALYWAAARTGQLADGRTGALCAADALRAAGCGFAGLAAWPRDAGRALAAARRKRAGHAGGKPGRRLQAAAAVAAACVLLGFALAQLAGADDRFAGLLHSLGSWHWSPHLGEALMKAALGLPVGAFFYGLACEGPRRLEARPRPSAPARLEAVRTGLRSLPDGWVCGTFAVFGLVYAVFFGLQGSYLFGVFTGRPPEGFTVAQYARQGFFELCRVMLINLTLLAGAWLFARRELAGPGAPRAFGTALLAESLLLWATAAAKLGLYIGLFGFTVKRLLAAWALLVLGLAAVRSLASLRCRCAVVRPAVLTGAVCLAALFLV